MVVISETSTAEFVTQLYVSVPFGIFLIILFCLLRYYSHSKFGKAIEVRRRSSNNIKYPRLQTGFLIWMVDIWTMDSNTFFYFAGFDALMFRLYLKTCIYICLVSMPYALFVLLPIYGTGDNGQTDFLGILSILNVVNSSGSLYASVVGQWLFSFITLYYFSKVYLVIAHTADKFFVGSRDISEINDISWFNYKAMVDKVIDVNLNIAKDFSKIPLSIKKIVSDPLRMNKRSPERIADIDIGMEEEKKDGKMDNETSSILDSNVHNYNYDSGHSIYDESVDKLKPDSIKSVPIDRYTVMIRNLPSVFQNEINFTSFMNSLFPEEIDKIYIIPDVRELIEIQQYIIYHENELKIIYKKYYENEVEFDVNADENIVVMEGNKCFGFCGKKIDIVQYHKQCIKVLKKTFQRKKTQGLKKTPTAFVKFKTIKSQCICISTPIKFGLSKLRIEKAPFYQDLLWSNLRYSSSDLMVNNICVSILFALLLVFWSIPVAAIQAIANLDEIFSSLNINLYDYLSEDALAYIQGSFSVLILDVFLLTLPFICKKLTELERKTSYGRQEIVILNKYYDTLVFCVLLVTVISGVVASSVENFVESFSSIFSLLATSLASMSTYFLLYVLLNTFLWLPLELFRPAYFLKKWFRVERLDVELNRFHYSFWFGKTMLIFVICLTYSVMSPIMWIFGLIYFVFALFVFSYQLTMCYIPRFETGAKMFPIVFQRITYGIFISLGVLFGLMVLKTAYVEAALVLPLIFMINFISGKLQMSFRTVFRSCSLTSAQEMDRRIGENIIDEENGVDVESYMPPVLSIDYDEEYANVEESIN